MNSEDDFLDALHRRRAWFQEHLDWTPDQLALRAEGGGHLSTCPCCGYPTIGLRGGYEICELCNWEDDLQDDPEADEVRGGPNGDYSLTEARRNFAERLTMYRRSDTKHHPDSQLELQAKQATIQAFDAMSSVATHEELKPLWKQVARGQQTLSAELKRKVEEHDRRVRDS